MGRNSLPNLPFLRQATTFANQLSSTPTSPLWLHTNSAAFNSPLENLDYCLSQSYSEWDRHSAPCITKANSTLMSSCESLSAPMTASGVLEFSPAKCHANASCMPSSLSPMPSLGDANGIIVIRPVLRQEYKQAIGTESQRQFKQQGFDAEPIFASQLQQKENVEELTDRSSVFSVHSSMPAVPDDAFDDEDSAFSLALNCYDERVKKLHPGWKQAHPVERMKRATEKNLNSMKIKTKNFLQAVREAIAE